MLSQRTYVEIDRLTTNALQTIRGQEVIERVTVIRGYKQLLGMFPDRADFEKRLAKEVLNLKLVAERHASDQLAMELQIVSHRIDAERVHDLHDGGRLPARDNLLHSLPSDESPGQVADVHPRPDVARGRIAARIGRLFSSTPPDRPGACTGITDPIALYGDGYRLTP